MSSCKWSLKLELYVWQSSKNWRVNWCINNLCGWRINFAWWWSSDTCDYWMSSLGVNTVGCAPSAIYYLKCWVWHRCRRADVSRVYYPNYSFSYLIFIGLVQWVSFLLPISITTWCLWGEPRDRQVGSRCMKIFLVYLEFFCNTFIYRCNKLARVAVPTFLAY